MIFSGRKCRICGEHEEYLFYTEVNGVTLVSIECFKMPKDEIVLQGGDNSFARLINVGNEESDE